MSTSKKLLLALLGLMFLLLAGCEEVDIFPKSRELIVVNSTTGKEIVGIEVEVAPVGQRKTDTSTSFLSEDNPLEAGEQFSITLSPYVYRTVVRVQFTFGSGYLSKTVIIDLPDKAAKPTRITLAPDGVTLTVTGEYVAYFIPDPK